MASLISALDNQIPMNMGEKGHAQHGWATDENTREKIVQFNFQCVRSNTYTTLDPTLRNLLKSIRANTPEVQKECIPLLYAMIGYTRDIIDGKGEYSLAYMMILVWYEFYPELAVFVLKTFVDETIHKEHADSLLDSPHPYGSWKDIKYLCAYVAELTKNNKHPLILAAVQIINAQLRLDAEQSDDAKLSLAGKWVARQGNHKFGWLFNLLSEDYFKIYIDSAKKHSLIKAILKAKTEYRKLCSGLNQRLDTIQIKQCGNIWAEIDHSKTTSITVSKQKKALLNVCLKGGEQRSDREDRIVCADNFKAYIDSLKKEGKEVKGKRIGMADFTTEGLKYINAKYNISPEIQLEIDILNSQWRDNSSLTKALGNMIALVDTSDSMSGDPLNVALALGIRIAEKSALGKRILTFNTNPRWVSLQGQDTFVDMLREAKYRDWGGNTDFYKALSLIHTAIQDSPTITKSECEDMILVILSDMQIDQGDSKWPNSSLYQTIESKYKELGITKFGQPIKPPHILFWNLRSTVGFPSLSAQPNSSMMSGFSPALLNTFCEMGMEALQQSSPWTILKESLEKPRYQILRTMANLAM